MGGSAVAGTTFGGHKELFEFVTRGALQGLRRGAWKCASIERRPKADHPHAARKRFGVPGDHGADLPLDQRARHGSTRMTLRDYRAQPNGTGLTGVFHRRDTNGYQAC